MKKYIILLLVIVLFQIEGFAQIFVPKGDVFIELQYDWQNKSINDISNHLGYNTEESYTYINFRESESAIWAVVFKSFTDSIIYIAANNAPISVYGEVRILPENIVRDYLKGYDFAKDFNSNKVETILSRGIAKKSLTAMFLAQTQNQEIIYNGDIYASKIGYNLTIKDGLLIGYTASDGLNKWARDYWSIFANYKKTAEIYWQNNSEMIIKEVNIQAQSFSEIPMGMRNEFIELHRTSDGTINFKMLLVSHYNSKITMSEFKEINYGRYQFISDLIDRDGRKVISYKVNKTYCSFKENGDMISCYTINY